VDVIRALSDYGITVTIWPLASPEAVKKEYTSHIKYVSKS
jgi:hypothetical protein